MRRAHLIFMCTVTPKHDSRRVEARLFCCIFTKEAFPWPRGLGSVVHVLSLRAHRCLMFLCPRLRDGDVRFTFQENRRTLESCQVTKGLS